MSFSQALLTQASSVSATNTELQRAIPITSATIETFFRSGALKAHHPLLLGSQWLVQPMPPFNRKDDSSMYELVLTDIKTQDSSVIEEGNHLMGIVPLGDNLFATLQSDTLQGLGSTITIYAIVNINQIKTETLPVENIVALYSCPKSKRAFCLRRTDRDDKSQRDFIEIWNFKDISAIHSKNQLELGSTIDETNLQFSTHNNKVYFSTRFELFLYDLSTPKTLPVKIYDARNDKAAIDSFLYSPLDETVIVALSDNSIHFIDKVSNTIKASIADSSEDRKVSSQQHLCLLEDSKHFISWDPSSTHTPIYLWNIEKRKCVEALNLNINTQLGKNIKINQVVTSGSRLCVSFSYEINETPKRKFESTIVEINLFKNKALLTSTPIPALEGEDKFDDNQSVASQVTLGFIKKPMTAQDAIAQLYKGAISTLQVIGVVKADLNVSNFQLEIDYDPAKHPDEAALRQLISTQLPGFTYILKNVNPEPKTTGLLR